MADSELSLGKLRQANASRLPGPCYCYCYCYRMVENNAIKDTNHLTGASTKIGQL